MCPIKESIVQFTYNREPILMKLFFKVSTYITVNKCPCLEMNAHRVDFEVRKRTKSKEDNSTLEVAIRRYIETTGYLEVCWTFLVTRVFFKRFCNKTLILVGYCRDDKGR